MEAVQDPLQWGHVLDMAMSMTGAKAAIITLRDKPNCQIVNDIELEQKYHSPLIRGFSNEAIIHYLTNLRTIDPWAEFQRTYYPHRPLQMSSVCPQESVKDQRFFDWLTTEGCQDSIVFELDRMSGYWTALNLFVETPDSPEARRTLEFANENCDLIRNAWIAAQSLSKARQSNAALLDRAAGAGTPTCIVGANGELLDNNSLFFDLLKTGAVKLSGSKKELSFSEATKVIGLERWEQNGFLRHSADTDPVVIVATAIDPDPIFAGKRENNWLLTCSGSGAKSIKASEAKDINLDALTRQERDLFHEIANGKSVAEAGTAIQLQRSRSFEVWSSVKKKLGIKSAHQLRN